jgi:nucleoside-diphosphate-sugar epimerase
MKITIIGCGYVGKAIAQHWKQQGITVTGTTLSITRLQELEPIVDAAIVLDGSDEDTMRNLLMNQDVVLLSIGARGFETYEKTYVGTANTLVRVLAQTPKVQQVIYTSSYAVYGDHKGAWVTETAPTFPVGANKEYLAQSEQILLSAANANRNVCVFRLGGIYGPGRELSRIFARAAGTTRLGTGEEPSNWIHLEDIVGAIAFAQTHRLNGIYNLVQDGIVSVRELLEQVCDRNGFASVSWDSSQPSARGYSARVSNQKLKDAGYAFRRTVIQDD